MEEKSSFPTNAAIALLALVCLLCGGLAFYYGAGALLLEEGTSSWNTAEFAYRAIYLTFGYESADSESTVYSADGLLLPKIAFILYLLAFLAYFLGFSVILGKKDEKKSDYVLGAASGLSIIASLLFFFSHFAVSSGEGYFLIPGEGFLLPAALSMIPALAFAAKFAIKYFENRKKRILEEDLDG